MGSVERQQAATKGRCLTRLMHAQVHATASKANPAGYLYFSHEMSLRQASLQIKQLSIATRLVRPGVNALIHRASIWKPAFPLHGSVHATAIVAVLVYDVRLVGSVRVALCPLGILNVQDGAHPLPVTHFCHRDYKCCYDGVHIHME